MFLPTALRLRRYARLYARLGVPIAPPHLADGPDGATTDLKRVEEWWSGRGTTPDIATLAGLGTEIVESDAAIAAYVVRMFDAVGVSAYPAVMRINADWWAFFTLPPAEDAELPTMHVDEVTRVPSGTVVLLPPSRGRSWRSPWQRRLSGDAMRLDVLLGLAVTARDALAGRSS